MWIAKRSATRGTFPGQLDNVVAGGQPSHLTVAENVIKECNEEASIPKDLAQKAYPTGFISYLMEVEGNLRRHVMYVYDLIMPFNFTPRPNDGEVEAFSLMKIELFKMCITKCSRRSSAIFCSAMSSVSTNIDKVIRYSFNINVSAKCIAVEKPKSFSILVLIFYLLECCHLYLFRQTICLVFSFVRLCNY